MWVVYANDHTELISVLPAPGAPSYLLAETSDDVCTSMSASTDTHVRAAITVPFLFLSQIKKVA